MEIDGLDRVVEESVREVLETMFFSDVFGNLEEIPPAQFLRAELAFRGTPSGRMGVQVTAESASRFTADFLGVETDEVTDRAVGQVLCELANMVCGSMLSRMDCEKRFDLSSPELVGTMDVAAPPLRSAFALEDGAIVVDLDFAAAP